MKSIGILGSTGSIGTQTLEVIDILEEKFQPKYLTSNSNIDLLAQQALKYEPDTVCISQEEKVSELTELLKGSGITVFGGRDALLDLAGRTDVDLVMNGLVGAAGMEPTIEAVKAGVDVALSNKESMVMAGGIINELLNKHSGNLFPVDSEHSAIWQCLKGEKIDQIRRIILTGSGGPFRKKPLPEFADITREDALKHPNWDMGSKITVDSATMMNKGLEVIEAHWLFQLDSSQIDIVVHPQSIIHSMVEFSDGSIKAQLGVPDMKIPIQYSLTYPDHCKTDWESLDFFSVGQLTFEAPDFHKFPCIRLAYDALDQGGSAPIVLNVANDEIVAAFLNGMVQFIEIPELINEAISQHQFESQPDLDTIAELSHWTKTFIQEKISVSA